MDDKKISEVVFVEGIAGQLFKDQAVTVTISLLASLVVALTVIPMLSAAGRGTPGPAAAAAARAAAAGAAASAGAPTNDMTLGRFSLAHFFPTETISRCHGKPRRWKEVTVCPLYHPAAALHQGGLRQVIEADFRRLPEVLKGLEQAQDKAEAPQPQQLSMF
jgi:DNA polymerase